MSSVSRWAREQESTAHTESHRWILAIADDLTGALECGAQFAFAGLQTSVTFADTVPEFVGTALVVDSETRHLSPDEAAERVGDIARSHRRHEPFVVYKKTDSTLRGNIASELAALYREFPDRELLYVPAYPAMGRTVRNGELLVHGVPVHQTHFGNDALNPVRESRVHAILGSVKADIRNAESDEDIQRIAREITASETPLLVAGPAAIAGAVAERLSLPRGPRPPLPHIRSCLVVNGSMHPLSSQQIEHALHSGCIPDSWRVFPYDSRLTGLSRATAVGDAVRRFVGTYPVEALVVFGGDTAYGVTRALGVQGFVPCGEVLPGVPLSRSGDMLWITRAGGFGDVDLLCRLAEKLT